MKDIVVASHCSRCRENLLEGELVGLDEVTGQQQVLCCLCLDPRSSRLAVVHRLRKPGNARGSHGPAGENFAVRYPSPTRTGHWAWAART